MEEKRQFVICPYCCHKFAPSEADFRLNEACAAAWDEVKTSLSKSQAQSLVKQVNQSKRKKAAQAQKDPDYGKAVDEKLYAYYREILKNSEEDARQKALQYAAVQADGENAGYSEADVENAGFPQKITYTDAAGKKHFSERRLCPNCHNVLPIGYGLRETILISILGDARAGKSIYLTTLIHELENNVDFASKLSFIGDAQVKKEFYDHYQKPLLEESVLIHSTERKKIPPFAYNYWYQYKDESGVMKENTIDIIFYDIAGEDLRDDVHMRQNGFNIKDSSGLIFLLDPTSFKKMEDLFLLKDKSILEMSSRGNSNKDIFSAMFNYFLGMDREKSSIPFAMTVSKSDLFHYVELSYFNNKPESRVQNLLQNEVYRGYVPAGSVKGLNSEVNELLRVLEMEPVLNQALGCFKNVSCFSVSSLGKQPRIERASSEEGEVIEKGYLSGKLDPFRVKEPFYWILMKNKLLYKYENNAYRMDGETSRENSRSAAKTSWVSRVFARMKKIFK